MTHPTDAAVQPAATPGFIALLIAVSAVSPLGINMYLPSMPGMARALGVDFTTIQLTLSLYLGAMALGQLIIGPLSDRFGRRPVLLIGLLTFVAGSAICLSAQSIGEGCHEQGLSHDGRRPGHRRRLRQGGVARWPQRRRHWTRSRSSDGCRRCSWLLASRLDVTKFDDAAEAARVAVERFGRIDVLVNDAGNFFEELSLEQVSKQIGTNLL
jgi:hypothetical protein